MHVIANGSGYINADFFRKLTGKDSWIDRRLVECLRLQSQDRIEAHCRINKFGKPE